MLSASISTGTTTARTSRRANKRPPDDKALEGMRALGLNGPKPKASRYRWFLGRNRVLSELGRTAERLGDSAARQVAEHVLVFVDDGIIHGVRDARYMVRELTARYREAQGLSGRPGGRA
jgi:hypothetical protein